MLVKQSATMYHSSDKLCLLKRSSTAELLLLLLPNLANGQCFSHATCCSAATQSAHTFGTQQCMLCLLTMPVWCPGHVQCVNMQRANVAFC
jgi:hypothetical protein